VALTVAGGRDAVRISSGEGVARAGLMIFWLAELSTINVPNMGPVVGGAANPTGVAIVRFDILILIGSE
jgi:hypothetical protein